MSQATYSAQAFRPQGSFVVALLRELFAATPLGILLAAFRQGR